MKPFGFLMLCFSKHTPCIFLHSLCITKLQKLKNDSRKTNQRGTHMVHREVCTPIRCVLPRVCVPGQWLKIQEEDHWPVTHRSADYCRGTLAALLERNGQMSDGALGSPQAVERCSAWSPSGWQLPAREGCQVGCDSCAVHKSPRFFGALPFLTCLSADSWEVAGKFWCWGAPFSTGFHFLAGCLNILFVKMGVIGRWPLAFLVNMNLLILCRRKNCISLCFTPVLVFTVTTWPHLFGLITVVDSCHRLPLGETLCLSN